MKKRIYLILIEENLFHPHYLKGLIQGIDRNKYEIAGITFALDKYKNGFLNYLITQFYLLGLWGFYFSAINGVYKMFLDILKIPNNSTLAGIAINNKMNIYRSENVNSKRHLSYLKKLDIDIIISSNGHIFKKEILNLPKIACINRHSALLPKYGGVLPVFWAMYNNEDEIGVSAHHMVEKIDEGNIISQSKIKYNKSFSLFRNYIYAFDTSINITLRALNNIENNITVAKFKPSNKQYFSHPDSNKIKEFRKKKKGFSLSDIIEFYKVLK